MTYYQIMSGLESVSRDKTDTETSWKVKEPDEAKYNFSNEKGVWQPRPEDILSMFEKLADGHPLPLKWTCPGRRPPDRNANSDKNALDGSDMEGDDSKEEELKAPETSAFDFDEPYIDGNSKLIPKRTPGGLGRTPKTEKRVARMDNIMKSLQKQQLQRAADREARKSKGSPVATPGRSRLLNFGTDHSKRSTTGSHTSATSSPRFAGSSSASNSSPLLNRGSMFMTPTTSARKVTPTLSARKMTPKSITNGAGAQITTADSSVSEAAGLYSNTFTSSQQGSSFDFSDNRSEQISNARDRAEISTDDLPPSTASSPKNTYTPSPALNNPVTTISTKAVTSGPFLPSITSTSLSLPTNMTSSSSDMSTDKESINTTDSNQQFVSSSFRTVMSTAAPIMATNLTTNASTSETQSNPSAGAPTAQAGGSQTSSGVNPENVVSEASSYDQPPKLTESVSLSSLNINSDAQNFGNTNWKPQSSS